MNNKNNENKTYQVLQHSPLGSHVLARYNNFMDAHEVICNLGKLNDYPTQAWYTIEVQHDGSQTINRENAE